MRDDLKYVLFDPRGKKRGRSVKTALRVNLQEDFEEFEVVKPVTNKARYKDRGFRYRLLTSIIRANIGKRWDDVYSTICERVRGRKGRFTRRNARVEVDIVSWYVQKHNDLYVDADGIIRDSTPEPFHVRKAPKEKYEYPNKENTFFEVQEHYRPASCGCSANSFRYRGDSWRSWNSVSTCRHGNEAPKEALWYVVTYAYHKPDEICHTQVLFGEKECWGINGPSTRRVQIGVKHTYYRDVPDVMAKPYVVRRKSVNHNEKMILQRLINAYEVS